MQAVKAVLHNAEQPNPLPSQWKYQFALRKSSLLRAQHCSAPRAAKKIYALSHSRGPQCPVCNCGMYKGSWPHRGQRWGKASHRLEVWDENCHGGKSKEHFRWGHSQVRIHSGRRQNVLAELWNVYMEYGLHRWNWQGMRPWSKERDLNAILKSLGIIT